MSSSTGVADSPSIHEKLVFVANALAALSTAVAAIAWALKMSRQGKLIRINKNEEVESSMPHTKGAGRDYWDL
jgi:hypothetical protein